LSSGVRDDRFACRLTIAKPWQTSGARLMEMANVLAHSRVQPREIVETFVKLLAPFARM